MQDARNLRRLAPRALEAIVVAIGLFSLWIACHLPIYSDEQQWKLINSRLFLDGGKLVYLFPECRAGFLLPTPLTHYPSRFLDGILYADMSDPLRLRLMGVATFVGILVALGWLLRSLLAPTMTPTKSIAISFAALSFGVLPLLLVFNRPEQAVLVILITGLAIAARQLNKPPPSVRTAWVLGGVYSILVCFLLGAHIKAIFLLPAFWIAAALATQRVGPTALVAATSALVGTQTFSFWQTRTTCPESPFLIGIFNNLSLTPKSLENGMGPFAQAALGNLSAASAYLTHGSFQHEYQSQWAPTATTPITGLEHASNFVFVGLVVVAFALIGLDCAIAITALVRRQQHSFGSTLLAFALGVTPVALAAYQITKNFYEIILIVVVLFLATLFALRGILRAAPKISAAARYAVPSLLVAAVIGQFGFATRFIQNVPQWQATIADRAPAQRRLANLANKCGISPLNHNQTLIVDDFAYTEFWRSKTPIILPYFEGWWATGVDQRQLLRERAPDAIIGACYLFPTFLKNGAAEANGYCCRRLKDMSAAGPR